MAPAQQGLDPDDGAAVGFDDRLVVHVERATSPARAASSRLNETLLLELASMSSERQPQHRVRGGASAQRQVGAMLSPPRVVPSLGAIARPTLALSSTTLVEQNAREHARAARLGIAIAASAPTRVNHSPNQATPQRPIAVCRGIAARRRSAISAKNHRHHRCRAFPSIIKSADLDDGKPYHLAFPASRQRLVERAQKPALVDRPVAGSSCASLCAPARCAPAGAPGD